MTHCYPTWHTHKTPDGYRWVILEVTVKELPYPDGTYAHSEVVKSDTASSRAQAVGMAKRWVRYLCAQAKRECADAGAAS
jgi:hypothetical protein